MREEALAPIDPRLFAAGQVLVEGQPAALQASRCATCGRHEFPARSSCPACGAATEDAALAKGGVVAGLTAVNHPPPGALIPAPYTVAVVAFPEGISILGVVPGVDVADIAVGDPARSVVMRVGERTASYGWRVR